LRNRRLHPGQLELAFEAPPAAPKSDAYDRANRLLAHRKLLGKRWFDWAAQAISRDSDAVGLLCALTFQSEGP